MARESDIGSGGGNDARWSFAATAAISGFMVAAFALVGWLAGSAALGYFSWSLQVWKLAVLGGGLGNQQAGMLLARETPETGLWRAGLAESNRTALPATALLLLAAALASLPLGDDPRPLLLALLGLGLWPAVMTRFLCGYLIGRGGMAAYGRLMVLKTFAGLALIASLVDDLPSLYQAAAALALLEWLPLAWLLLRTRPRETAGDLTKLRERLRRRRRGIGWSEALNEGAVRIDLVAAGLVLSPAALGVYGMVSVLGKTPLLVYQSLARLLLPVLAVERGTAGLAPLRRRIRESALLLNLALAAVLVLALTLVWSGGARLLPLGVDTDSLRLFAAVFAIYALEASLGLGGTLFLAWERTRVEVLRQALLTALLAVGVWTAGGVWGLAGVAAALAVAYVVHLLPLPWLLRRTFGLRAILPLYLRALPAVLPLPVLATAAWLGGEQLMGLR